MILYCLEMIQDLGQQSWNSACRHIDVFHEGHRGIMSLHDRDTILFFRPCCSDVLTFTSIPIPGKKNLYNLIGKYWRFVKDFDA